MLNKRKIRPNIVDTNVTILPLSEAVRRWTETGSFMVTESQNNDAFEAKDCNIPFGKEQAQTVDKIDATLAGLDFVKETQATAPVSEPTPESAPVPEPAPVE